MKSKRIAVAIYFDEILREVSNELINIRNEEKFPNDFMFQLVKGEHPESLKSRLINRINMIDIVCIFLNR